MASTGIVVTQRVQAAGKRAIESHAKLRRVAESLGDEMDELTAPATGVPVKELDPDDSMVIAIERAVATKR